MDTRIDTVLLFKLLYASLVIAMNVIRRRYARRYGKVRDAVKE